MKWWKEVVGMEHVQVLVEEAREYTSAYCNKYLITDRQLRDAIFYSHLAWLINKMLYN